MRRRLQGSAARGVIAAFAALALAACGAKASGDVHPGPGGPDAVAVVARDNTFEPARLELRPGKRSRSTSRTRAARRTTSRSSRST